jgi:MoaA/NifB/PqqE/SkfB family radical SAM enzyme
MIAFDLKKINSVHIELSNYCNASCPMCPRFFRNSPLLRPDLNLSQISIDQFKQFFPKDYLRIFKKFIMCGTHGDPGMAKDLYEICEYIGSVKYNEVVIHTNGGMKSEDFWFKLGQLFKDKKLWSVIFSIDGLEDTNHLYRRGVDWTKLMNNLTAFIRGGGQVVWEYLIFKHNEHQVEQARQLSIDLGIKEFRPKKALGVFSGDQLSSLPAVNSQGDIEHVIESPTNPKYRNLETPTGTQQLVPEAYQFNVQFYKDRKRYLDRYEKNVNNMTNIIYQKIALEDLKTQDNSSITCKAVERKEIFIASDGTLLPCCYVGTQHTSGYAKSEDLQLKHEMNKWSKDAFNLNNHSIVEILSSGAFDRIFADSWNKKSCGDGKLIVCANACGENNSLDRIHGKQ